MRRVLVIGLVTVLVLTACGGDDTFEAGSSTSSEAATSSTAAAAATTTTTTSTTSTTTTPTTTTTVDPSAFAADRVLEIDGVSAQITPGEILIELDEEPGMIRVSVDGEVDVIDGLVCLFCFERVRMGPDSVIAADVYFIDNPAADPNVASMGLNDLVLQAPLYHENGSVFIEAGPDGAVLLKEGTGFRLLEGSARLTDGPEGGTASESTGDDTETTEAALDLPSYSDVVATYPAGTELCTTQAGISGGGDGYTFGDFDGESATIQIRDGQMLHWCLGARYIVTGPFTDENGEALPVGALLTLDADFMFIRVSTFD